MLKKYACALFLAFFWSSRHTAAARKVKRIAFGAPLYSNEPYNTFFFISIKQSFGCLSEQRFHRLGDCQDHLLCGGSLINPEFVLTAAHCLYYYEVVLKTEEFMEEVRNIWEVVASYIIVPKPKKVTYSDFSLLGGSTNIYTMTQRRHVYNVFPHEYFAVSRHSLRDELLDLMMDVALIQACQPFNVGPRETVRLAPMKPFKEQQPHLYQIFKEEKVCLYVGFGKLGPDKKPDRPDFPWAAPNPSKFLRYIWRHSLCWSLCKNTYGTKRKGKYREHECHICSVHHGPEPGASLGGDSGSPVMCDGYFVAHLTTTVYEPHLNYSLSSSFPLNCVKDAITPRSLKWYKSQKPGEYHPIPKKRRSSFNPANNP